MSCFVANLRIVDFLIIVTSVYNRFNWRYINKDKL